MVEYIRESDCARTIAEPRESGVIWEYLLVLSQDTTAAHAPTSPSLSGQARNERVHTHTPPLITGHYGHASAARSADDDENVSACIVVGGARHKTNGAKFPPRIIQ